MAYLIGVDGGTESIRAFVFDLEGRPKGSHASAYQTHFPKPSWAEQNPEDWWRCMGEAVHGAVNTAGIRVKDVLALCVDTPAVRGGGGPGWKPLRPAMIWMDALGGRSRRCRRQRRSACASTATVAAQCPPVDDPEIAVDERNQPELFAPAHICEYQDYINWRLTGRWVASLNMSVRWHYQSRDGGLPLSLLDKLDLADLEQKWPRRSSDPATSLIHSPDAAIGARRRGCVHRCDRSV
jgi:sugar (pentulose or hexulose) kinase